MINDQQLAIDTTNDRSSLETMLREMLQASDGGVPIGEGHSGEGLVGEQEQLVGDGGELRVRGGQGGDPGRPGPLGEQGAVVERDPVGAHLPVEVVVELDVDDSVAGEKVELKELLLEDIVLEGPGTRQG